MASGGSTTSNPYTLGRGKVIIRKDGSDDWHDLLHVTTFTNNVTPEKLEHFTSRSQLKRRDKTVITQVTFGGSMEVDVPIMKNIKLFFMAETEIAEIQASGTWTVEAIVAPTAIATADDEGAWIKLPKLAVDPGTPIVLTGVAASPVFVEGTDFEIDYENGLLKTLAGTTITTALALELTGAFLDDTRTYICAGEIAQQLYHVQFIGDPADGVKQDVRGFALLVPSGDFQTIGDEWETFTLDVDWQDHADYDAPLQYVQKAAS